LIEGSALRLTGRVDEARTRLEDGARLGHALIPNSEALCLAELVRLEIAEDNWDEAGRLVERALAIVSAVSGTERPSMAHVFAGAALVHHHRRETDRAARDIAIAVPLLEAIDDLDPYRTIDCYLDLALASARVKDLPEAHARLDEAERRLSRLHDAGILPDRFVAVRTEIATTAPSKTLVEPLTPAEHRVLRWLPTHRNFGEIGQKLFLSRNTVKTHAMAIYRKLGVTSRSEAVAVATEYGLLEAANVPSEVE